MRALLFMVVLLSVISTSASVYLYYDNKRLSAYVGACNLIFWQIEESEARKFRP